MVCDMVINLDGEITAYQFYPAVMLSHARFTYTEVAAILANTKGREAQQYAQRVPDLLNLHSVYEVLLKSRAKRGAVDFETKFDISEGFQSLFVPCCCFFQLPKCFFGQFLIHQKTH
mgnify:CR=1 FL=1